MRSRKNCADCQVFPILIRREQDHGVVATLRDGFHKHLISKAHLFSPEAAWIIVRAEADGDES
ncbi:hypothetical protein ABZY93_22165 [Streptomyces smyrnaeus]|uniref:hypothetical protein n=1 Tax=Streptomyces smyrnaeus TaxID=1387713 RepID=UPI0033A2749D